MELNQIVSGIVLTKDCSIKPDSESKDSKTIHLKVRFNGVTLGDVFQKAMSNTVVQWQNGVGRPKFDMFKDGQTVEVDFKAPAKAPQEPPEVQMARKLAACTTDAEREALIAEVIARAAKLQA